MKTNFLELFRDLSRQRFYGTLELEFRDGKLHLGQLVEKMLFDQPTAPGPEVKSVPRANPIFRAKVTV